MKVIINGTEYRFSWKHKVTGSKRHTKCFVKKDNVLIGTVKSHVDSRDQYLKNKGRIRSLTKALKSLTTQFPTDFTRVTRTDVWDNYAKMTNQPWQVQGVVNALVLHAQ